MARYSLVVLKKDNKKDRRALLPVFSLSDFSLNMPNILHNSANIFAADLFVTTDISSFYAEASAF